MDFKKKNDNKSSNNKGGFSLLWMYGILFAIVIAGSFFIDDNSINKPVSWTEFESYVSRKGVKSIVVYNNTLKVEAELTKNLADSIFTKEQISKTQKYKVNTKGPSIDGIKDKIDKWQSDGTFTGDVSYMEEKDYSNLIWSYGPIILMIVIFIYIMRKMSTGGGPGGGVFSVGKSNAEVYDKDNSSKVTFNDVAGLAEAKTEVEEIVDFLKNPGRYTELGGKIPKGALLVGPPGTGKTLLARAVAG